MKMFLLSVQKNFYIILSSYLQEKSLNFMSSVGSQFSKVWMFFWKFFCRASSEIIFQAELIPENLLFFERIESFD